MSSTSRSNAAPGAPSRPSSSRPTTSCRCGSGWRGSGARRMESRKQRHELPASGSARRNGRRRVTMSRIFGRNGPSAAALAIFGGISLSGIAGTPAIAAEKITYLLPAPPSLPAFAPWVLAKHLGYYSDAGYDVEFVVARGGVDVAKQIGVGNAPIGGAIGDTPIIVRGNGVPVKSVGLMGGGAMTVVVGRKDRGIEKLEDLRGKKISVLAFQDTTYYALLGALASKGITKNDVNAQAVGPAAVASLVVAGTVDACACTPDWEIDVKEGVKDAVSLPTKDYFQSMSQAILASDKMIAERPDLVRALGRNLVLWRDAGGRLQCLEDYCPHRGARLSLGEVMGDHLACRYHGVTLDGSGTIVRVPAMPDCALEGRRPVESFPVAEANDAVFVYFASAGHPEAAPLTLPEELTSPDWTSILDRN